MTEKRRLNPEVFTLQTALLKDGYFTDKYFHRARRILQKDNHNPHVLMQVFCRAHAVLCGIDEAIAILKEGCDYRELEVHALYDGDHVTPWETVMTIQGPYEIFAHLETLYLGVLARGTRIATHTRDIVNAANRKKVLFFGARHDHYLTQVPDGYAAFIGGADAVATDAHGALFEQSGSGTIPHALIAAYEGDSVLAAQKFVEHQDDAVDLVALVDFDNDCVKTSLDVAHALGDKLKGVRLDTSGALVDKSLQGSTEERPGVNPELVQNVRAALDAQGFAHVQIYISGGITVQRINEFEAAQAPVDAYGVGSSILANLGRFDFTADIVQVNGKPLSKVGRQYNPNERLSLVN